MRWKVFFLFLLVAAAGPAGVAPCRAAEAVRPARGGAPAGEYRIGPEDLLQISVWKNEPMSRTVPVRPDGKISLPLLNDVQAAGYTPMELRNVLIKRLAEYIPNPEVSVIVQEVRSFKVSVIGEVVHPGRYELKGQATVLDALAQAGGFSEFSSRKKIAILRPGGSTVNRIVVKYKKVVEDGGQVNFYLLPGDVVVVE